MNDLVNFQHQRIQALQERISDLELKSHDLEKLVIELCNKDCTEEFKELVLTGILNRE
tara:strand:- start:147 stop:320 length:174 start_codon:yes stop_codon:yes gene_type:complete